MASLDEDAFIRSARSGGVGRGGGGGSGAEPGPGGWREREREFPEKERDRDSVVGPMREGASRGGGGGGAVIRGGRLGEGAGTVIDLTESP
jgi:hypothetical protein